MPATKIVFTEKKLARFVADVTRHAMGSRAFNAALAARGRWQAMCGDHFWTTWFGPCRQTEKEAKADAKAHNAANPGHHAFVPPAPMICDDGDDATPGIRTKRRRQRQL
jgi:hypothetical protein